MAVSRQVVIVREDARLYVAWDSQHTVLLEAEKGLLIMPMYFAPDAIEKVNLELRPSSLYIQAIDFFA